MTHQIARLDARAKLTGQARYAGDIEAPGTCHVAIVRSQVARGRILRIDTRDSLAMPGVVGVFTGRDIGLKLYGRRVRDVPVLAVDETRFVGERIAAVVAESRFAAQRAADRVVVDVKELPAVLDPDQALKASGPPVHETAWAYAGAVVTQADPPNMQSMVRRGRLDEVERLLAASPLFVERVYSFASGHQGYIEPQACVASIGEDGVVHVWMANKSPYRLRAQLAECLDMEPECIEIHPVVIGGDFGGKGSPMDAPLCVELARLTGRPAKLVQRYGEDLIAANPRHSGRIKVRIGCADDGVLTAFAADILFDGGAYAGFKPAPTVSLHGLTEIGSSYHVPAAAVEVRIVYTNTVPRGHMRAPGAPAAVFAFESALDELAAEGALDPIEIRRRNLLRTGQANPWGEEWIESRGDETLEAALAAYRPLQVPDGWRHGRGIGIYDRATRTGKTSLRLQPGEGGSVLAEVPMPETGTGAHTVVREGLARALRKDSGQVEIRQVSTSALPHDDGVGGSRVTGALSQAVAEAAAAFEAAGSDRPVTAVIEPSARPRVTAFCVQIAQVVVDPESGQVRVLEVLTAIDVADIVNPAAHRVQVEGGAAMGFGLACLEDLVISEGRVWAANLGEFRIPSTVDVPAWRTVLVEGGRGVGALNVKSVGELANVPTAAAIAGAIADAVGVRARDLPLTAGQVYAGLKKGGQP